MRLLRTVSVFACFSTIAFPQGTRTWEQSKFEDLTKGTANGVAIRSVGALELAPTFKMLSTTPSTYLWSIASDSSGVLYAAAGAPARVYRITADGQSTIIFEPSELQVQALVVDKNGAVYASTAPDGKVYKIEHNASGAAAKTVEKGKSQVDPAWTSSVYFDPQTKYIWDLALDSSGNLYVATGDQGQIFKVTAKGEHSLFFKSDEVHIRVLALDDKGNLIAGSDGSGLVYRISPSGEAFVLYSAPKKEITALALDDKGNLYASGVGEKKTSSSGGGATPAPQATISAPISTVTTPPNAPGVTITQAAQPPVPLVSFPAPGSGATGGSEIYKIAPDGSPTRLWSSREDIVYALGFDPQGRLLAGTGNRGHIYAIRSEDDFTDLLKAGASQITAFTKAPSGGLYASSSNLGKIFVLGPGPQSEGTYESDVFDAKIFSRWGRAEYRGAGNVDLYVRSGNVDNPDRNWSPWKKVELRGNSESGAPPARFAQWKAILHAGNPAPQVQSVTLNYLSKNVAPVIDEINVQPNTRFSPLPRSSNPDVALGPGQVRFDPPPPAQHDRDSLGVKWTAHDDNDDQMVYTLYYRGEGESRWLLLKDNLFDKFYSFDASLLPDGAYTFKVVASDAPSHSPGEALTTEKESARFEVDTTAPRIENLSAAFESGKIHVTFRAVDAFSTIRRAEYSIDAGDWQYVEPVGQITDSKSEEYDFRASVPALSGNNGTGAPAAGSTDHVVVVRVWDRFENMAAAKTILRAK